MFGLMRKTLLASLVFFAVFYVYSVHQPAVQLNPLSGESGYFVVGQAWVTSSAPLWLLGNLLFGLGFNARLFSHLAPFMAALGCAFFALFLDDVFPAKRSIEKVFNWMPAGRTPLRLNHLPGIIGAALSLPWMFFMGLNPYAVSLGLLLAFSFDFWRYAVMSDAAPLLDVLFFVILLGLCWRLQKQVFETQAAPGSERWEKGPAKKAYLAAFFLGTALANNTGMFLLVLTFLFLLWQVEKRVFKNIKSLLAMLGLFALGFSPFVLAVAMNPFLPPVSEFMRRAFCPGVQPVNSFPAECLRQFTPLLIWLAPVGFWIMLRQSALWGGVSLYLFLLACLGLLSFTGNHLLCYVIAAWWMAYAAYSAERWRLGLVIVSVLLLLAPVLLLWENG